MERTFTKEQIFEAIDRSDKSAVNALIALYARQTADEQAIGTTRAQNGIGFAGCDAEILSSFAEQALRNRALKASGARPAHWSDLSPKQMEMLRKKLKRYSRQLLEIAEEKAQARAEALAPVPSPPAWSAWREGGLEAVEHLAA